MEGFPVANISQQVIAPALETIRSAAAYAKSIECMNLYNRKGKSETKVRSSGNENTNTNCKDDFQHIRNTWEENHTLITSNLNISDRRGPIYKVRSWST